MKLINWAIWMVTGALLITMLANIPATLAQQPRQNQPVQMAQASDRTQVIQVVVRHLSSDGGTAQPQVRSVRILNNYALANWTRGEAGGQALLTRSANGWRVVQSGGGAMDADTLRGLGVPADTARILAQ